MGRIIDRHTILRCTLWGVDIYAHILRQYYPEESVIKVVGRDCGICRNPFASGRRTLHISYSKNDPSAPLSDETARHHDDSGTIPDGNALDFAALHYGQTGQELLDTLNREMHLHLDREQSQYASATQTAYCGPKFSFFKAPITNIRPHKSITIPDAYNYIVGPYAKERTQKLRNILDKSRARNYKSANFDYATFCGEFTCRKNDALKSDSCLLCIDFDHVPDIETLFARLLQDEYFTTSLLFRSPSGDGLKWIIETDSSQRNDPRFFKALEHYSLQTYGIRPDASGKDIARACFLPYDPNAYINPKYR